MCLRVSRKCFEGALQVACRPIPIYMGASGTKMTELVGEIGDGLLLGTGTRPDQVAARRQNLSSGAARVGRAADSIEVGVLIVTSCSEDGSVHPNTLGYAAKSVAQTDVADYEKLGFDPEQAARVRDAYDNGECRNACALLSRKMIDTFTAAGTPDDCLRAIDRYVRAGVTLPILLPFGGDMEGILRLGGQFAAHA